jgi:hypothetical protein
VGANRGAWSDALKKAATTGSPIMAAKTASLRRFEAASRRTRANQAAKTGRLRRSGIAVATLVCHSPMFL